MSRVYLDTNYLFGLMRQTEQSAPAEYLYWREGVEAEIGSDRPLISALVVDELAYRLVLAWLCDSGDAAALATFRRSTVTVMKRMRGRLAGLWKALDNLDLDLAPSHLSSMHIAQSLMSDLGLAPRDAFHAAYAIDGRCDWIVSSDATFDRVPRLRRLGP